MRSAATGLIIGLVLTACSGQEMAEPPSTETTALETTTTAPSTTTEATTTTTAAPQPSPASGTITSATPGSDTAISLLVDGATRVYRLYVPESRGAGPAPLVLDLHGLASSPLDQDALSDMTAAADRRGIVLAQPRGKSPGPFWSAESDSSLSAADVAFLRAVVEDASQRTAIDPERVYAMGMSNGGGMAHRLACEAADLIAGIGPVAGAHTLDGRCEASDPVVVVAVHGTEDRIVPFDGLEPLLPAIPKWATDWAVRNGCTVGPVEEQIARDVVARSWSDCRDGVAVTLYVVDAGHGWPGTSDPERAPATTDTVSATDLILDFFAAHPR